MTEARMPRCCLTTPNPGAWVAGVDDGADDYMIDRMHSIRDRLSYQMPVEDLIWALRASVQIDSRTMLGGDIQRCMLSMAADRLLLLAKKIDPHPWATKLQQIRDAWAVLKGKAVVTYVRGSVYDRDLDSKVYGEAK